MLSHLILRLHVKVDHWLVLKHWIVVDESDEVYPDLHVTVATLLYIEPLTRFTVSELSTTGAWQSTAV